MILIACFLVLSNALAFLLMGLDKGFARRHRRRIPERVLFLSAAFFSAAGSLAGMYCFRHKTKHLSFVLGMPAILAVQLVLCWLWHRYC